MLTVRSATQRGSVLLLVLEDDDERNSRDQRHIFVQALTSDSSGAQSVKKIPKIQLLFRQKSPCFAHC